MAKTMTPDQGEKLATYLENLARKVRDSTPRSVSIGTETNVDDDPLPAIAVPPRLHSTTVAIYW